MGFNMFEAEIRPSLAALYTYEEAYWTRVISAGKEVNYADSSTFKNWEKVTSIEIDHASFDFDLFDFFWT